MSLFITSLNSGSNGNCYYIGNATEAVLIDAGLSCKETEHRMQLLGLSMKKVRAVFISHEHADHIKGLSVIAEKYTLPVYITSSTFSIGGLHIRTDLLNHFNAHEAVTIGNIAITAFPKYHDAADPHSFIVECERVKVGIFTDIGSPCRQLIKYFSECHAAFLESNYDEAMLENGRYPWFLKNRIRGGQGHLSNRQALEIFIKYRPSFMSHLLLAHLSKENNCPILAKGLFEEHARGTKIIVASRYEQTPVFEIEQSTKARLSLLTTTTRRPAQLSLF